MKNFDELLEKAKEESEPQRLLLLFAKAEAMRGPQKTSHKSGTLTPIMCVDKLPEEISNFEALVKEADGLTTKWDFIFIASMSGKAGIAPSSAEVDPLLHKMSNDLIKGADLSRYIVLDREQRAIIIA